MAKTVVGLFDDMTHAQQVVRDLQNAGFTRDDISMIANDSRGEYGQSLKGRSGADDTAEEMGEGAAGGAGIGAVLGGIGGLLVGLGALAIPGIGPVIAAGPIAAALAGAGIGAVAGGLLGALVNAGLPEEQAHAYTEGVRRGGTLVMVRTSDDQADQASSIMNRHGAIDIDKRSTEWRTKDNWNRFDENAGTFGGTTSGYERSHTTGSTSGMTTEQPAMGSTGSRDFDRTSGYDAGMTGSRGTTGDFESFDAYDRDFRNHYDTSFSNRGYTYDQYRPAYQYGYELRRNDRFRDKDWSLIERDVRSDWERRHPDNAWDDFKDAVRTGWQQVTGRR